MLIALTTSCTGGRGKESTGVKWAVHYLTDIPRQREEYEEIYGTRRNAECHITSILRAGVEYLFYFMTNSRYIFVTK